MRQTEKSHGEISIRGNADQFDPERPGVGLLVKEACRKHGINSPRYYQWKPKYDDLDALELEHFK